MFWSALTVIGVKIKGFYLVYFLFWVIFFVPAILHYDLPRKLLSKALPLLEQLDHSMKYERRSILDKSELLVDVQLPQSDLADDEKEDEIIREYKLEDFDKMTEKKRKTYENLEDDEDDEEEEAVVTSIHGLVDEEEYEHEFYPNKNRIEDDSDEYDDSEFNLKKRNTKKIELKNKLDIDEIDIDNDDSLLPDESMPSINDVIDNYFKPLNSNKFNQTELDDVTTNFRANIKNIESGDKLLKQRKPKTRPSLLEYYNQPEQETQNTQKPINLNEITIQPASPKQLSSFTTSTNSPTSWKYSSPSMSFYSTGSPSLSLPQTSVSSSSSAVNSSNQTAKIPIGLSVSSRRYQQNDHDIDETFDFLDEELNKY